MKKLLVRYTAHQTLHWLFVGIIVPVFTLLMQERGLSLFQVGLSFALYSGAVLALELPTGGLADAAGRRKVYVISLVFSSSGLIILLFASSFITVACAVLFLGAGRALSSGTVDAWFAGSAVVFLSSFVFLFVEVSTDEIH